MFRTELILIYVHLTKPLLADEYFDTSWLYNDTIDFQEAEIPRSLNLIIYQFIRHNESEIDGPIPKEFDARKAWSQCESISRIINQEDCDLSWAICSTMVMSDRTCIASEGKDPVEISIDDVVTCCENCSNNRTHKCSGGHVIKSFVHFIETGVVSSKCKSFDIKKLKTPNVSCKSTCTNSKIDYKKDKRRSYYILVKLPSITMNDVFIELMKNGPICVSIRDVGDEFKNYKKGVFIDPRKYPPHKGRAVRLIGWGTEDGIPYWIVANSWGTNWGENGFFRIRRGANDFGIEENYVAVGIKPLKHHNITFDEKEVAGRLRSSSQYLQPWNIIFKIYILHSMYSITKECFYLVMSG